MKLSKQEWECFNYSHRIGNSSPQCYNNDLHNCVPNISPIQTRIVLAVVLMLSGPASMESEGSTYRILSLIDKSNSRGPYFVNNNYLSSSQTANWTPFTSFPRQRVIIQTLSQNKSASQVFNWIWFKTTKHNSQFSFSFHGNFYSEKLTGRRLVVNKLSDYPAWRTQYFSFNF